MNRKAYSTFVIRSVDDERRMLEGVATTITADRMNDIVEPKGARFKLPIPFLWQHDAEQPIGHVVAATPTDDGIPVRVQLTKATEPGRLKDRLDEAWQSIKLGLVRGLSIGFSPKEYNHLDNGGLRFRTWEWLELSAVTIPANQEASITTIKRFDRRTLPVVHYAPPQLDAAVKAVAPPLIELAKAIVANHIDSDAQVNAACDVLRKSVARIREKKNGK
jgi:HK97 family phage prohead protease